MSLLATVNGRGTLAARPAAAAANEGYIYSASDASLYRSNGSSWDTIGGSGIADQGTFTYLDGTVAAAPATPAAGKLRLYAKTGKVLAVKDDAGVETVLGAGGGGGGLVFLQSLPASNSATLDFASFISSLYDEYLIKFRRIRPDTSDAGLLMRMGTGAGPTYDTGANYSWASHLFRAGGEVITGAESGATSIPLTYHAGGGTIGLSASSSWGLSGWLNLADPQGSGFKQVNGHISYLDAEPFRLSITKIGAYESATAVTALRFFMSSGNIAAGTISIYGFTKS